LGDRRRLWLNHRVKQRRGKYHPPNSRKPRRGGFLPLILFLALVAGAWFWWHTHSARKIPPQPKPAPQKQQPVMPLPVVPGSFPRSVHDVFEAQVALERQHISAGSLDGVPGSQTRAAILAFQRNEGLTETGALDADTRAALQITAPPLTTYTVTSNDLARLQPLGKTWLAKSQQTTLDYETLLELVAEKSHAHPNLIRRLNPGANWTNVVTDTVVRVPDVSSSEPTAKAAFVIISLGGKTLDAYDAETNLLAHFPCSIAARFDKRPVGELHVKAIAPNPNYTFDPEVFPESEEARQLNTKLILPPGPNNPVGAAWISLDKTGYGMHGTPRPEDVGRTESHGCFRLANWNAEYLLKLVWIGLPVYVEP
jgi:lipoprotein-anchoring transpeptidase ErfK/SrfK